MTFFAVANAVAKLLLRRGLPPALPSLLWLLLLAAARRCLCGTVSHNTSRSVPHTALHKCKTMCGTDRDSRRRYSRFAVPSASRRLFAAAAAFAKLLRRSGLRPLLLVLLLDAASEGCPGSQGTFCAAPEFYIEFQCHTEAVVAAAVPLPPPLPLLLGWPSNQSRRFRDGRPEYRSMLHAKREVSQASPAVTGDIASRVGVRGAHCAISQR